MKKIFLAPRAGKKPSENFLKTIQNGYEKQKIEPYLTEQDKEVLQEEEILYIWGNRPGGKAPWEKMEKEDYIFFYQKGKITWIGELMYKTHNKVLADALWGQHEEGDKKESYEYVYFLDNLVRVEIDYSILRSLAGYKSNAVVQGFQSYKEDGIKNLLVKYGSIGKFIDAHTVGKIEHKTSFWWVNQGQTYVQERDGGFIWAPKENDQGQQFFHWTNVSAVKRGNVIFHYANGKIRAVSFVSSDSYEATKPDKIPNGAWHSYGWQADVEYHEFADPVPLSAVAQKLLELNLHKGPMNSAGGVNQGYLYNLNQDAVKIIADALPLAELPEHIRKIIPYDVEINKDLSTICSSFASALKKSSISFGARHNQIVRSFIASLATKRFVILTGLSGSGKTQIAIKLGEWLGKERSFLVPVRPDWTGSEAIFGYEDALQPCSPDGRRAWYVPEVLNFMLKAASDPENPYLLILDEMNLAHVERYFADVLSGMESMQPCLPNLHFEDGNWRMVPGAKDRLPYPTNLFVVGTVNVDETTYMFSPKVLDRANTFEFRVDTTDLSADAKKPTRCEAGDLSLVRGFRIIAEDDAWHLDQPLTELDIFLDHLRNLHSLLSEGGFEFGHRVFYEAVRFAAMHEAAGDGDPKHALDLQVMQKVLPRLHGSRRRLEPILCALGQFCFDLTSEPLSKGTGVSDRFNPLTPPEGEPSLTISFDKIRRMTQSLRANQFASFTE